MTPRHFRSLADVSNEELLQLLDLTAQVKQRKEDFRQVLSGQTLAMLFQKPSTRTRVSFQVGMAELGGIPVVLNAGELQLGRGESIADTARVLSRYAQGIMARVFAHSDIEQLAKHATVPVINGLCDLRHPCQALCDYFTISEHFGSLSGLKLAYLGDGNNVAHSLAYGAAKLGVELVISSPAGYDPDSRVIDDARAQAAGGIARISLERDPEAAVKDAQVVYTDVWTSMGQEAEQARRLADLAAYQLNLELFSKAAPDAIFMHCLPAHRGEEVTSEVADHSRSVIFDQAENRLHTQKALLVKLLARS